MKKNKNIVPNTVCKFSISYEKLSLIHIYASMEAGMSGFEGKPLDVEHLYLQICRLLGLEADGLKSE